MDDLQHECFRKCGVPLKERLRWGGARPPMALSVLNMFDHSEVEGIFDMCSFCSAGGYHIASRLDPIKPTCMQMHAHTLTPFPSPLMALCVSKMIVSSQFLPMYVNDLKAKSWAFEPLNQQHFGETWILRLAEIYPRKVLLLWVCLCFFFFIHWLLYHLLIKISC